MYRKYLRNLVGGLLALALLAATAAVASAAPADDQFAVAAGHYSASRWSDAVGEFRYFLQQFPEDARASQAKFFLAESLVQQRKYSEARPHFEELMRLGDQFRYSKQAQFRAGETAYLTGKSAQARATLEEFYANHPRDAWCSYAIPYLGELALISGEAEQAQKHYSEALRRYPQGPLVDQCRFGTARALEQLQQYHDAQRFYQLLADNRRGAFADDAILRSGVLSHRQGRHSEAAGTLKAFVDAEGELAASPLRTHGLYWLGTAQLADRNWQASAASLKLAAEADPNSPLLPAVQFSWAEALRQGKQHDAALDRFKQVYQHSPGSQFADDALHAAVLLAIESDNAELVSQLSGEFGRQFGDSALKTLVEQAVGRWHLSRDQHEQAIAVFEQLTAGAAETNQPGAASSLGAPEPIAADPVPEISSEQDAIDPARLTAANWYYLAVAYLGAKRYEDALAALQKVEYDKHARLVDGARVARAAALVGLEQYEDALPHLEAYLRSQPAGPDAARCRAHRVVALAQLGRFAESSTAYEQFAQHHAGDPLLLPTTHFLAERAYEKKQFDLARPLFQMLTNSGADEFVAKGRDGLAWIEFETGDAAATAQAFERMLQENPDAPEAAKAALMRARALEKLDKLPAAVEMYQLIIDNHPTSPQMPHALLGAAKLLDELQLDTDAALLLKRFVADYPQSPQLDTALYLWAWVLDDLEQPEQADEKFALVAENHPKSRYWADSVYRLAQRAAGREEYRRADELADRLIAAPAEGDILAHALYLKGQLAAAEKRWADVEPPLTTLLTKIEDSPLRLPARYWIAESSYRQNKFEQAGRQFTNLLAETVDRRESWTAMVPLRLAQVLAHAGEWEEAYSLAADIEKQYPEFRQQYEVDYLLGRCLQSQAQFDFDAARAAYQRVTQSTTGGASETAAMAQWMIGETYFHQKNYEQATRAYYRVAQLYDYPRWQALALLQIGKCLEVQNRYQRAIEIYQQVLEQYEQTDTAQEAGRRLTVARQRLTMAEPATRN